MDKDNLIKMANKIGYFFESMPDRDQSLEDIANHIKKFWAPSMRKQIIKSIDTNTNEGMSKIVLDAIKTHRNNLS